MNELEIVSNELKSRHTDWSAEELRSYGVVITAPGSGSVTIDFAKRNFGSGITPIREAGPYKGSKWKQRLIADAIRKLETHDLFWKSKRPQP